MLPNYEHAFRTANGKWIFVPTAESRECGYKILNELKDYWSAPDYFYHLQPGGHVAALKAHQGKKFFIRADIRSFFPSVSRNKIVSALKKTGMYFDRAKEIADISTVISKDAPRKKILPFGFVQSPILASIALNKSAVGKFFDQAAPDVVRTVYADDILYSSNNKAVLENVYLDLRKGLVNAGFDINENKSHGPLAQTCAFNVDLSENPLKISDPRYREFVEEMYGENRHRSEAMAYYVRTINPEQASNLFLLLGPA